LGHSAFGKGDTVVYPHHGAVLIEDLVDLEVSGKSRAYFKLRLPHGKLTVMVPVDSTEMVGLREVVSGEEIDKVFDVLRETDGSSPILWTQRYKTNLAKIVSGDAYGIAEVVRDLSMRKKGKGLSTAEVRMLAKAREVLISELTASSDSTQEDTEAMMDAALGGTG